MTSFPIKRLVCLASATLALTGCTMGPDFKRPEAPADAGYSTTPLPLDMTSIAPALSGRETQHLRQNADIPFEWWKQFKSPALNTLVEKAFHANPTLPAARAALHQAQEMVYAQQGYFFPTVGATYNFERQELAGNNGGSAPGVQGDGTNITTNQQTSPPYNKPAYFNTHTSQLTFSFTPDIFGSNIRAVESLTAQAEVQRYNLQATYITLASTVVDAAINEASLRAQIDATKKIIADNAKLLDILKEQFKNGLVMRMDVAAQETALAQAKQLLPPLERQFEQNRDLIKSLVGNLPNQDVPETFTLTDLALPQDLPLSLPSKIIDQRPDVRAAEEAMRSANAEVGTAIANRLPQFTITGAAGGIASKFSEMYTSGGPFWNIIGNVSQVIFDGNTLLHRERAADQALLQAAAQYRLTVLTAYQNIADTLHALTTDANTLAAAVEAEQAAKVSLDLTETQLKTGFVALASLLQAEQAYQQALLGLVQAQTVRFGDTAMLYTALGGGWWNRTDLALDDQQNDFFLEWFNSMTRKTDTVTIR